MNRVRTARQIVNLRQGRNDWYRIENRDNGPAQVMIYDEIGYFGVTAQDFIKDLAAITGPIELHLNTPGGEVFDGIAIYNSLKQRGDVTVIVDSLAASIGSVIAMAGGKVIMARNSTMMIHDGFGLCVGNAADMLETAKLLDKTSDNIASIYADRTGKPAGHWREQMRAETWLSAEETVAAGLADEVQGAKAVPENSWDLSIFGARKPEAAPPSGEPASPPADDLFAWDPDVFRSALREATAG